MASTRNMRVQLILSRLNGFRHCSLRQSALASRSPASSLTSQPPVRVLTMKAILVRGKGQAGLNDVDDFKSRPDYIRVRTKAVALNPTDWKHIDYISDPGAVLGCDFAGVVEEVGEAVQKPVRIGDRVCGFVHGGNVTNHEDGAFAERVVCKDGLFLRIPDSMTFANAAGFPVGLCTAGQALYQILKLPTPDHPPSQPFPVLIYGGSTATGALAIQLAKLSGLSVVTTASPRNHDLLRSLGADKVFDYNEPSCSVDIREWTDDCVFHAFDTIGSESSMSICAGALAPGTAGHEIYYTTLRPGSNFPRKDVKSRPTMLFAATGEEFEALGRVQKAKPEKLAFMQNWLAVCERLISERKVKTLPLEIGSGWSDVLNGLERMRCGKYNGIKLVANVS